MAHGGQKVAFGAVGFIGRNLRQLYALNVFFAFSDQLIDQQRDRAQILGIIVFDVANRAHRIQ